MSDLPTAAGLVIFSIFFIEEQVEAQLEAHELASDAAAGLVIFSIFFIEEQVEAQLEAHELASDAAAGLASLPQLPQQAAGLASLPQLPQQAFVAPDIGHTS